MTQEQLKKYIPYIAVGLAAVVFLVLVFRPLNKPETPADPPGPVQPAPTPDPTPTPTPDPVPQPETVTVPAGTPLFSGAGFQHDWLLTITDAGLYGLAGRGEGGWVQLDAPEDWANPTLAPAWCDGTALITETDPAALTPGSFLDPFADKQVVHPALVRFSVPVTDLRLTTLVPDADPKPDQTLLELVSLAPGDGLMLRLDYPGSASIYGLYYTTPEGTAHRIVLSESGMDGSLAANKY